MTDQMHTAPLAVITGASSGIGKELARQFGEHGFDLLVAAEHRHETEPGSAER
jgi:short-subunit dehydrogenase